MTAPELSEAEAAVVARFEAAEVPAEVVEAAALALCREFPATCAGSGGMGGKGGPCGAHLEVAERGEP